MTEFSKDILTLVKDTCKGKKHVKLTVGCVENGKMTIKTFGENGELPNKNYVYEIASITKVFTATVLAKYIYENKMSLENSIQEYFVGLSEDKYYPTLKRLATHTAGYSVQLPFTWGRFLATPLKGFPSMPSVDEVKEVLQKHPRQDKDYPWKYANFGFMLIGYAIGTISGEGYWDTMDDFLAGELELENTYTGTNPEKNLHGFSRRNKDCGNTEYNKQPTIISGEGDISSTAEDLLKYAMMNMYEKKPYLTIAHKKQATVTSMFATILEKSMGIEAIDMGLGWMINRNNNNVIWHSGDADAFSSYLAIDKEKRVAAVVLSNYRMDVMKIGVSVLKSLQKGE